MTGNQFVQLNRTFREVGEDEISSDSMDSEYDLNLWGDRYQIIWNDLEQRFRTVILAESGAGKTREMEEQCNALRQLGKAAWFVALEMLAEESVEELLDFEHQLAAFVDWRDLSRDPAWIFLDAVDELKLKDGDFQRALFRLRRSIGTAHDRTHIVISCRPSDWAKIDLRYFRDQLPPPRVFEKSSETHSAQQSAETSEERFLAPLRGNPGMAANAKPEGLAARVATQPEELKVFRLRSLTRDQIEQFTKVRAPGIAAEFLKAVEDHDRWLFARQPQDLLELLALWYDKRRLGTYKQQHEAFLLSSLREREGRPGEESQISPQTAREGVERLSLSLALSKRRTFLNVSENVAVGSTPASVCPRELLSNWSSQQIKALLRLRTFDPSSYGRVKFHRREVEEFLAAERLLNLAKAGNDSKRKLSLLLFSKGALGEKVFLPSMKEIAAWVASDSSEFGSYVRATITEIEPELLLSAGDPEHLPTSAKVQILEQITALHPKNNRRSLSYSAVSLKRFAEPGLAATIRKIFESGDVSDSVGCLLLAIVKEGRIGACAEMVAKVAIAPEYSNHWRTLAVMGLVACEKNVHLAEIVGKIFEAPEDWPAALLADIIDELAPTHLSVSQLKSVLEASARSNDSTLGDFSQPVLRLAAKFATRTEEATELKAILASLILSHQLPGSVHYHPISRWSDLSPALQVLCLAKENSVVDPRSKEHFFACLTAIWFLPNSYHPTTKIEELVEQISNVGIERNVLFQWELEYALSHFPAELNEPMVARCSLITDYSQNDVEWLEELIKTEKTDIRIRLSAMLERVRLWNAQGRPQGEEVGLRDLGGDGGIIDDYLNRYLAPESPSAKEDEWEAITRKQESKEEKRLEGWLEWRRDILVDPGHSFSSEKLPRNRHLMLEWLMADNGKNGSYQLWGSGEGVAAAFSEETKEAAGAAFLAYWRNEELKAYSEQEGDRSTTPYSWIYALTGVSIESEIPSWGHRLSEEEVRQATRIAMVEINGLAGYIEQLIHDRPQPVKDVLGAELTAQWAKRSQVQHLPLLQNVTNGSPALKSLLLDVAINLLLEWSSPTGLSDEGSGRVSHHLSQLLRIIQSCWDEVSQEQRSSLQNLCETTLRENPESKFSLEWLRLTFSLDPNSAIGLLEEIIGAHPPPKRKDAAVRFFANLFGDRYRPVSVSPAGGQHHPEKLARLILMAYTYVVPAEDQKRPSGISYTPNARDDAEHVRSSLVNQLIEIDGPAADQEIERLAASSVCAPIEGYLRSRQRVRGEIRADRNYSTTEISEIERRFESVPKDRNSLFRVMMARLEDLQDYFDTDDFVPLLTLQRIDSEEEMQRAIAMLLKHSSNGIYEVFREPEVKGRKRTDIQFCVPGSDAQSVIEIKVGEKPAWNVSTLLHAMENQLVNQYLLQRNRRAGCLLITYGGHVSECPQCGDTFKPRRKWKDPDTGKFLDFEGLIERLRIRAKEIVDEHEGAICLEVFGLDLRDPTSRKKSPGRR